MDSEKGKKMRYKVVTEKQNIETGHSHESGLPILTQVYSRIRLVDTKGVWPDTEFGDYNFATLCADALNRDE